MRPTSGEDCTDGEVAKPVLLVKSLPWRAKKLGRIFKQLDKKAARNKSKHSRQQTLPRILGPVRKDRNLVALLTISLVLQKTNQLGRIVLTVVSYIIIIGVPVAVSHQ